MSIKIYIDQGHNPENPNAGAEGNGLREQDLVYVIGLRLAARLRANPNFEVRLSRPTEDTLLGTSNSTSLAARVNDANRWGADYFISLHTNAAASSSAFIPHSVQNIIPSSSSLPQFVQNLAIFIPHFSCL